jgi:hypothetical protein
MATIHAGTRIALAFLIGASLAGTAVGQGRADALGHPEIGYINGGIGQEQADFMRAMGAEYPVQMTFSEHNQGQDEFVADVHLRISDRRGQTVLDLAGQGPIFLLRLPQGSYTVEAEHQGEIKTRRFDVAAGRHDSLSFSWS